MLPMYYDFESILSTFGPMQPIENSTNQVPAKILRLNKKKKEEMSVEEAAHFLIWINLFHLLREKFEDKQSPLKSHLFFWKQGSAGYKERR